MTRYLLLLTLLLLLPARLFAQAGIKQSIQNQLQNAQEQHDQQMQDALLENHQTPPTPGQPQPVPDTGWIQVLAKDGSLTKVRLYVSHPSFSRYGASPRLPALLLLPDQWGANEEVTQRADELAGKGYFTAVVDFYDGKTATNPDQALALRPRFNLGPAQVRMTAAVFYLMDKAKAELVNPDKIAVLGWGAGGEQALRLATTDLRIKATALFYAPLITEPERLKNLKGPVFGVFGNDDHNPAPDTVHQFESALATLQIPHEIHVYEGAAHGFASRLYTAAGTFNQEIAAKANQQLESWLATTLATPPATQPK